MKKSSTTMAIGIAIVLSSGCEKVNDYLETHPDADIKECPILKFSFSTPFTKDSIIFTYNAWGDPVSGTRMHPESGRPNYIFKYDKKHRLTDYIGPYSEGRGAEFWHKYFYDGTGNIVSDSCYIFTQISNGVPTDFYYTTFTLYTYDAKRRIVKDSTHFTAGGELVNNYAYNAKGNREGREYDEKTINFRRTNKVWMFVDRDYSLNNPFIVEEHNSKSLPTKLKFGGKGVTQMFLANSFFEAQITYGCR